jgi:hypothetical protein
VSGIITFFLSKWKIEYLLFYPFLGEQKAAKKAAGSI